MFRKLTDFIEAEFHKCPPLGPTLSHLNTVHTPTTYLFRFILMLFFQPRLGLLSGLFRAVRFIQAQVLSLYLYNNHHSKSVIDYAYQELYSARNILWPLKKGAELANVPVLCRCGGRGWAGEADGKILCLRSSDCLLAFRLNVLQAKKFCEHCINNYLNTYSTPSTVVKRYRSELIFQRFPV